MTDQPSPSRRAGLRDEIVNALGQIATIPPVAHRREQADNVLALLYREWPWLRAETEDATVPPPADRAAVLREAAETVQHHGCPCEARLRRLAAEAPATTPEAQPVSCAHCGKTIRRITGTLTAWWVHDPGGRAFCYPWQPARSTRATPKPADEAQQPDTAAPVSAAPHTEPWSGATELASDREILARAATGIVGYRQGQGTLLHCLAHKPAPASRWADFHEVAAGDLDDGGICVHPRCGRDLLAPWPAVPVQPAAHGSGEEAGA